MNFETSLQSLLNFLNDSDNMYFFLYALCTCLLTQVFKKLFVKKVQVDVLHKFDFAQILPYVFGILFALLDLLFVKRFPFCWDFVAKLAVSAVMIGALASVVFKFVSTLSGKSLKSLMKDDTFYVFYTQLQYFGNIRQKLMTQEMSLEQFVCLVKSVSRGAKEICQKDCSAEQKKQQLGSLLQENFQLDVADAVIDNLYNALVSAEAQQ